MITSAIRSPSDDGETMRRANSCLALYFDPDHDPQVKADVRQSFVRALRGIPAWAMHRAFDRWERTGTRRPTPGEIVILAGAETKPLAEELARRNRKAEDARAEAERKKPVDAETAAAIMARAGFTPRLMEAVRRTPMSTSLTEAEEKGAPPRHWSETAPPDDPRWNQVRRARADSTVIQPMEGQQ